MDKEGDKLGVRQGCSAQFWCRNLLNWIPTGYLPTENFDKVFGRNAFIPDLSLIQVLGLGGGGVVPLARQSVAALLNAAHPGIQYPLTEAQVISMFQDAFDSGVFEPTALELEELNNLGCPLVC